MRGPDTVCVQDTQRIVGHVIQSVGRFREVKARRLTGIAIVEAYDKATCPHQLVNELVRPVDALHGRAHDQ